MAIRIIKHESIPQTGSYEVRFLDGRPSVYHYFDDDPGRRSIIGKMTGAEALQAAKTLARGEQDKLGVQATNAACLRCFWPRRWHPTDPGGLRSPGLDHLPCERLLSASPPAVSSAVILKPLYSNRVIKIPLKTSSGSMRDALARVSDSRSLLEHLDDLPDKRTRHPVSSNRLPRRDCRHPFKHYCFRKIFEANTALTSSTGPSSSLTSMATC
jgi:hypothetical protein